MNKAEKYYDENHVPSASIIHLDQEWYNVSMLFKLMEDFANQRVKEVLEVSDEEINQMYPIGLKASNGDYYDQKNRRYGAKKIIEHLKKKAE